MKSVTALHRARLVAEFEDVLGEVGAPSLLDLLYQPELLDSTLESVGRALYTHDRSLHDFRELINALVARQRRLRKQLTLAWDVVDAWSWVEPSTPRLALPRVVLDALITTAILNGMPFVAFNFWVSFSCLLRPGEALSLVRGGVRLPRDLAGRPGKLFLLLLETKTERRGIARVQYARSTERALIELAELLLRGFPEQLLTLKLFPYCMGTLRKRLEWCLDRLGIGDLGLSLGSFRGGGAIELFEETEDLRLVQWRGRWDTEQSMARYLQEATVSEVFARASGPAKERIRRLARLRPWACRRAGYYLAAEIPARSWPLLFSGAARVRP